MVAGLAVSEQELLFRLLGGSHTQLLWAQEAQQLLGQVPQIQMAAILPFLRLLLMVVAEEVVMEPQPEQQVMLVALEVVAAFVKPHQEV